MNTTTITSRPVDRNAVVSEKDHMRDNIFTYMCLTHDKSATLDEVCKAFPSFKRSSVWLRIDEMRRKKWLRVDGVRNRQIRYVVNAVEGK